MKRIRYPGLIQFLCVFLLLFAGCDRGDPEIPRPSSPEEKPPMAQTDDPGAMKADIESPALDPAKAVAHLEPTRGNQATGTVTFTSRDGAIHIVAEIQGLSPGRHGIHIHEKGDCSAPDATSAGGHFNPGNSPHGAPDDPPGKRHVGDLGNLTADSTGKARYERMDRIIAFSGANSIIGKAVIVHAQADDLKSQPTGNAGPRLACGVIQVVK